MKKKLTSVLLFLALSAGVVSAPFWNADGESTECYNDVRRLKSLGEDIYGLQNPGKFPLRCPYGNDDTTTNPNIQAAYGDGQYVFTENVWWAGGTR